MSTTTVTDSGNPDTNGTNLQDAINSAVAGDIIQIVKLVKYRVNGSFKLPKVSGTSISSPIIIQTTGTLPATGVRIIPTAHGAQLSQLVTKGNQSALLEVQAESNNWQLYGIDFTCEPPVGQIAFTPRLIQIGDTDPYNSGAYLTPAQKLNTIGFIFQHCYIHPPETNYASPNNTTIYSSVERGIAIESSAFLIDCDISGFAVQSAYIDDGPNHSTLASDCWYSVGGPGPIVVTNCNLEAHYSPFFAGGGDSPPQNTGTVSAASIDSTTCTVTLDNVTEIVIGKYISFQNGFTGQFWAWMVGVVTNIVGNVVTLTIDDNRTTTNRTITTGTAQWQSSTSAVQTATITSPTSTTMILSSTTGLTIGKRILCPTNGDGGERQYVQVTGIAGSVITFTFVASGMSMFLVPPLLGTTAYWNGYVWPSNITVTKCLIHNRTEWASTTFMKAWCEIKCVDTLLIEGCVFICHPYDGTANPNVGRWSGSEIGFPIYNQNGSAPWTTVKNIIVRNCVMIGINDAGIVLQGSDPYNISDGLGGNILFENLILEDPTEHGTSSGIMRQAGGTKSLDGVIFNHITSINSYNIFGGVSAAPIDGFVFKNTIVRHGLYGHHCQIGDSAIVTCFPSGSWYDNIILDPDNAVSSRGPYNPGPNQVLEGEDFSADTVGFRNLADRNWQLAPTSIGYQAGDDGKDIGADILAVYNAVNPLDWPYSWIPSGINYGSLDLNW